jgi:hypothetical protein
MTSSDLPTATTAFWPCQSDLAPLSAGIRACNHWDFVADGRSDERGELGSECHNCPYGLSTASMNIHRGDANPKSLRYTRNDAPP